MALPIHPKICVLVVYFNRGSQTMGSWSIWNFRGCSNWEVSPHWEVSHRHLQNKSVIISGVDLFVPRNMGTSSIMVYL